MDIKNKIKERHDKRLDNKFMNLAIKEAKKAARSHEIPIGCVIVRNGRVISHDRNRRNTKKSSLAHAEILAIKKACAKVHDWRLNDCTLYVTLEPCQMCSGAIVQSRVGRVVIGCENPKAGCAGSVINLLQDSRFNHQCEITRDVMAEECSDLLSSFFRDLREQKKDVEGDTGK
jgi:tRNA(adenine34) deaminase